MTIQLSSALPGLLPTAATAGLTSGITMHQHLGPATTNNAPNCWQVVLHRHVRRLPRLLGTCRPADEQHNDTQTMARCLWQPSAAALEI